MSPQRSRRQDAQHRSDYDVVTVLAEENCMGQDRAEQRKLRPSEDGPRKRPENRGSYGEKKKVSGVAQPGKSGQPDDEDRRRNRANELLFRPYGSCGRDDRERWD